MEGSPYRKFSISWKGARFQGPNSEFLLAGTWSVLLSGTRGSGSCLEAGGNDTGIFLPLISRFCHRSRGITCALKSTGVAHSQQAPLRQDPVPLKPELILNPDGGTGTLMLSCVQAGEVLARGILGPVRLGSVDLKRKVPRQGSSKYIRGTVHFLAITSKLGRGLYGIGRDWDGIPESLNPIDLYRTCVKHLQNLADAGLTHLHLLPTYQFGDVDDDKENWKYIDTSVLEGLPPDSAEAQARITEIKNDDGFNWGYNHVLWGVPKGSYASDPTGPCALNFIGLNVVLDVVYNHLHANGPHDKDSVLDKIVPGYDLRRNNDGFIENSTCVNNTASEHYMVDRLIRDDLLNWVVNYKVDGFRFDLMGHIMKDTMVSLSPTPLRETDGVDGSRIYIYGEGWNFGEVANNGRGVNASQFSLSGNGIGRFLMTVYEMQLLVDPFGHPLQQGFVTDNKIAYTFFHTNNKHHITCYIPHVSVSNLGVEPLKFPYHQNIVYLLRVSYFSFLGQPNGHDHGPSVIS
ncbi:hypothetical protein IGI04_019356 [Brassica rapa subsp. trilocularis]|uniref:Glycosyl hydrolase family 13 catalytic domain-containing protein n=1 Tax=Brassica rapa subsp. trilocularis TaxID=1813537 RepID=A0ABQ7MFZ8_BRACM|nr:hypothetical protein IGI04_019356 [Brassica rapa subsp. trilocularis]